MKAFGILWIGCECHKNPLLEGVGPVPTGVLQVLNNKNSSGLELPLWRLFCNLQGWGWTGVGHGYKGTPRAVGVSSVTVRAETEA